MRAVRRAHFCTALAFAITTEIVPFARPAFADELKRPTLEQELDQPWLNGVPPWRLKTHRRWRIWDPYFDRREGVLSFAYAVQQPFHNSDPAERAGGFGLSYGQSIQTNFGPLFSRGQLHYGELRIHDKTLFALSLARYTFFGGIALGPLEIGVGPGLTLLQADLQRWDPSLGGLCPRVSGFVSIRAGVFRVSVEPYSEVYWRWLGGPSVQVHGLVLDLGGGGKLDSAPR